ncbi:hypothetical protein J8J40_21835, partial [Mycobacterium tuberculosis]|nr:hypothetical protein [Mycobacterium tuberculosis]
MTNKIAREANLDVADVAAAAVPVAFWPPGSGAEPRLPEPVAAAAAPVEAATPGPQPVPLPRGWTPADLAAARAAALKTGPIALDRYETVTDLARLEAWLGEARSLGLVAFDTETTSLDALRADLVGFSLATAPGRACYVPIAHTNGAEGLCGGGAVPGQI